MGLSRVLGGFDGGLGVSPFFGTGLALWRLVPFAILWPIWNAILFRGSSMNREDVLSLVFVHSKVGINQEGL